MKVKELKEFLKECNNNMEINLEYCGWESQLNPGDCLMIDDCYYTDQKVYLECQSLPLKF